MNLLVFIFFLIIDDVESLFTGVEASMLLLKVLIDLVERIPQLPEQYALGVFIPLEGRILIRVVYLELHYVCFILLVIVIERIPRNFHFEVFLVILGLLTK